MMVGYISALDSRTGEAVVKIVHGELVAEKLRLGMSIFVNDVEVENVL